MAEQVKLGWGVSRDVHGKFQDLAARLGHGDGELLERIMMGALAADPELMTAWLAASDRYRVRRSLEAPPPATEAPASAAQPAPPPRPRMAARVRLGSKGPESK
jgi:hypothetical protein